MTTTLDVSLSQTLQDELDQPGVWAYAVYFDSAGNDPTWTPLVNDGTIENSGTADIVLPSPLSGGKIYFIIQSQGTSQPDNIENLITTESEINWGNASAYDFRYDGFEVTLQNSSSDQANLTSVNGFGLPMEVSIPYDNGTTATLGYEIDGSSIESDISSISTADTYDYTSGPLQGDFRMALSPAEAEGQSISDSFSSSDWANYVTSLQTLAQSESITISGNVNGADVSGVWHNGGYYAYQLEWDSSDDDFWLVPLPSSQIQGDIQISVDDLENSIYATQGTVAVYSSLGATEPFLTMNAGVNNQWGAVLAQFLTGFTAGYYGESGKSPNPQISGTVDLDQNINWDPNYAFGQNLTSTPPSYQTWDPYSQIFYEHTNSYGSGYTDALMQQYAVGGPLVSVAEPGSIAADVPLINLTIYADGETPAGYTQPKNYDYIAPGQNGYVVPTVAGSAANITLVFASAVADNAGVVLASAATITLNILTSDAGDVPVWSTVTFDGATAGAAGLWQNWAITGTPTTGYTATPSGGYQPAGTMLISGFPTADNGVSWYQIGVGDKTFNLYTTTSNGQFENQTGVLAVDGLATIATPASTAPTVPTFSVKFAYGNTVVLDPSLLVANTASATSESLSSPDAPVAGIISDGSFDALAGQSMASGNTITTTNADVAFAWTGEDNAPGAALANWISAYTNLINAGDVALITIMPTSGAALTTTATANIDGEWQTGTVDLAPGSYTVRMQEYLPTDTAFADPLTLPSDPLSLTVACFARGTHIATPGGEVAVEELHIGDLVLTASGRLRPIRWIGRRSYTGRFIAGNRNVLPIIIGQGAFGDGVPRRELRVSPNHAMLIEGMLVPAICLLNGSSIVQQDRADKVEYFHVELKTHDVILAEGAAAESFADDGSRLMFHNAAEYTVLYPDAVPAPARYCAPRAEDGAELETVRQRLALVSAAPQARSSCMAP